MLRLTDKKKKLRSAKKSSSAMASEVKMSNEEIRLWNLVKTHPLRVHVTIRMTECDASVDLIFSHLSKLKAVAVSVKLNVGQDFQDLSPDLEVTIGNFFVRTVLARSLVLILFRCCEAVRYWQIS